MSVKIYYSFCFVVLMEIFPITFPEESQLRQGCATQPQLITSLVHAVFLCDPTTGCEAFSFTTDGYGIFNVCTNLGVCRTHKGGSGTNKSAQQLTRRDRKNSPCPTRGSNPGSSDFNSEALTTELLPLSWSMEPTQRYARRH